MIPTLAEVHDLYRKAMATDKVVEAALKAAYGPKMQPEVRYRHKHPKAVLDAFDTARAAVRAYILACRARNVDPNDVADDVAAAQVTPSPEGIDYVQPDDPGPVDIDDADVPF
jgi:hypothetical protein